MTGANTILRDLFSLCHLALFLVFEIETYIDNACLKSSAAMINVYGKCQTLMVVIIPSKLL